MQNLRLSPYLELVGMAAQPAQGREGLPLYLSPVEAGFPSPAEDYIDRKLDLHDYLVHNRSATFFLRAQGASMLGAGIHDGDTVNRTKKVIKGYTKIKFVQNATKKRFFRKKSQ